MALKELAYLVQEPLQRSGRRPDAGPHAPANARFADHAILLNKQDMQLDDYTKAHLLDSQKRIQQILNARLQLQSVD